MGLVKVKIKFKTNSDVLTRRNLLEILNNHRVKVCGLFQKHNEFVILCDCAEEAELIFSQECYASLNAVNCTPLLPPELKANRSVIIHNVDGDILSNDENSIKSELERCNSWCKINEVIKFNSGKGMKIVFQTSLIAHKSRDIGLSLFYLHIPAHKIKKDFFYNIRTCYVCYSIEEHTSTDCPMKKTNPNYKICSNCAQTSHDFRTCTASTSNQKCINCNGKHSAMSMTCPARRKIISEQRADINKVKNYAATVRSPAINNNILDNELLSKSITITILASLKENESPGCFGEQLNNLLKVNNLPSICVDGYTPPTMTFLMNNTVTNSQHLASNVGSHDLGLTSASSSTHQQRYSQMQQLPYQSKPNQINQREAEDKLKQAVGLLHEYNETSSIATTSHEKPAGQTSQAQLIEALYNNELKFYKSSHTRTASMEDIQKAFREEKVYIADSGDNILPTSTALNVLALIKQPPTFISLKKEEFISLRDILQKNT